MSLEMPWEIKKCSEIVSCGSFIHAFIQEYLTSAYWELTGTVQHAEDMVVNETGKVPAHGGFSANDKLLSWVSGRAWGSSLVLGSEDG